MLIKQIQVSPQHVTKQLRNLRDNRDVRPQCIQVDRACGKAIVDDVSFRCRTEVWDV